MKLLQLLCGMHLSYKLYLIAGNLSESYRKERMSANESMSANASQ